MQLPAGTVLAKAKREGWTQQIRDAKQMSDPQTAGITPMQPVAVTMRQRAERHVQRIAGVTESVLPHLETMQPAAILDSIHEIEKLDRVARRNYILDQQPITGGALNVNILTSQAAIQIAHPMSTRSGPPQRKRHDLSGHTVEPGAATDSWCTRYAATRYRADSGNRYNANGSR